jgi:hypothetical protein
MRILKLLFILFLIGCQTDAKKNEIGFNIENIDYNKFNEYWYSGEAEITSYQLQQSRYGEKRDGHAVLVFVTEPFSKSKQVKLDNPNRNPDDKVSVMKLNYVKKFTTGIYPYSMMTSSFVPVSIDKYPDALKVTTTSQEWCGHTFTQINKEDNEYQFQQFSYFESEGDVDKDLKTSWLEDEIWNRIKINPKSLPTGEIDILPGTMYLRLSHDQTESKTALASLSEVDSSDYFAEKHSVYRLEYEKRSLAIYFDTEFPFSIYGWEENYPEGFGSGDYSKTTARRINSIKSPYWQKNSNVDEQLRDQLGI